VSRAARVSDLSDARRWRIVLARDRRYDGAFVYAVRSTQVFCRPSCPSRRPGRRQVLFFTVPALAREAGFRPCRRCLPAATPQSDALARTVREACRVLDARPDEPLSLALLAAEVGIQPSRLLRAFRRALGVSPRQYRDERRLDRFKRQLKEGKKVSPALYEAGYSSTSRVYERAHAQLGMTPASYSSGGRGARIRYAVVPCPLGRLLVAATDRGICRISIGADAHALECALRAEFPAAHIAADRAALEPALRALAAYWDGRAARLDLPLDVQATAFQRSVWEALRKIPYGSTRSYSAVARAVGRGTTAHAVALALWTNPAALVVPCHRVVRENGELGGYRWGLERKRALLDREATGSSD
jgi:AraC family transcriptional regulator, regulatory protein of adaptative response / methylated-DNA-[protein]-cysteine methyltransferase